MNKQLAIELINLIIQRGGLPFITLLGGVAQTLTEAQNIDDLTGPIIKRFPYTTYALRKSGVRSKKDNPSLIPDSGEAGILYFEDNGNTIDNTRVFSKGRRKTIARLDLVCWLNKKLINGGKSEEIGLQLITEVLEKLQIKNKDLGNFKSCELKQISIKPQNNAIFSKYSYDEKITQYLMPPFEYFSISLEVSFFIDPKCLPKLIITESKC